MLLILAIPASLVGVNAILAREFRASEGHAIAVAKSFEIREQLRLLLSLHQDIETGQRGFVLTANPAFLEPYVQARGQLAGTFEELTGLVADYPPALGPLGRLRAASREKLAIVERDIALAKRGEVEEAQALIATGEGRRRMDVLRALVTEMDAAEGLRLQNRTAASSAARKALQQTALALNAALIALLGFAGFIIARTLHSRANALLAAQDYASRQAAVFDGAKDAMITINPSGSIETLNPAAATLFGYTYFD